MKGVPYASAIGSLMYAMLYTRPDICHAVGMVSRFQSNPGQEHWTAIKCIMKYLRRTKDYFLVYGIDNLSVVGYIDSDFQSDKDDQKSTSGMIFMLGGGAVIWKSAKQKATADSITEAEYLASCEAAKEGVRLRKFFVDIEVVPDLVKDPMTLLCDNKGAIAQAKEPRANQKNKHVERKYHLLREII
ncbi:secreted RxLR effector protein 161-like [Telopea speciosissima]|uniref:secreted RxLR effector protein 161-like n=1 Tax=Telopea speciosissima TaxID=54955 RepID=UPI001CC71B5C|nr:secreted RxLR effector protein 161-like [Telopea speciosissima]